MFIASLLFLLPLPQPHSPPGRQPHPLNDRAIGRISVEEVKRRVVLEIEQLRAVLPQRLVEVSKSLLFVSKASVVGAEEIRANVRGST